MFVIWAAWLFEGRERVVAGISKAPMGRRGEHSIVVAVRDGDYRLVRVV